MEKERSTWENALHELVAETVAAERAYGSLIRSDRYPSYHAYFKKRHFEQRDFAKILTDEYHSVTERKMVAPFTGESPIFTPLEKQVLEDHLSDAQINVLITDREEALVLGYQKLLSLNGVPKTTKALLQSQAENLNSTLQKLRMDYNTIYRTGPIKTL
ncbi:hypothetical protein SAMN05421766_101886 [Zobellia uliginosa]|uniref:DUF2383 domain-containing protein n=1 Tax=Zobellia uliginosa TaxID=143224 RepID=A0ABY1KJU8_9FLAO|nr:hypothetical protein [Zobellia uliginosa]SIS42754.1 hypothetical protein SAMN05421766_101886 [Zobellia uliginosa]